MIKFCKRYWVLSIIFLVILGVIPTTFVIVYPPAGGHEPAKLEYYKTESIERCVGLYHFAPYMSDEAWLCRLLIFKYRYAGYFKPLTLSIGIAAFLMTIIAYMYGEVDIAQV